MTFILCLLAGLLDDAQVAQALRDKGATVTETKGVISSVDVKDCSKWTEDDFRQLGSLSHLKSLSLNGGLTDATLALLSGLTELESIQTNQAAVSDDGVKGFLPLKNLKGLKFFHPGKAFTGTGLKALAELPRLESLTVAGSLAFADEGMAAVATLPHLKEFRTWHCGSTLEGAKKLTALKGLKSLNLGQRLAYAPPTSVSDETIPVLLEIPSLQTLDLGEARLSVEALSRLKGLPELKKLTLDGIELTGGDADQLKAALPDVALKWTPPNDVYLKRIRALFGTR